MPDPSGTEPVLTQLTTLFSLTDLPVMIAIGVLSFALLRWDDCPNILGLFVSMTLGAAWGVMIAVEEKCIPNGWCASAVMKAFLVNGASATLVGWMVHRALDSMGWWRIKPPTA
jgi:hypothetical protein